MHVCTYIHHLSTVCILYVPYAHICIYVYSYVFNRCHLSLPQLIRQLYQELEELAIENPCLH